MTERDKGRIVPGGIGAEVRVIDRGVVPLTPRERTEAIARNQRAAEWAAQEQLRRERFRRDVETAKVDWSKAGLRTRTQGVLMRHGITRQRLTALAREGGAGAVRAMLRPLHGCGNSTIAEVLRHVLGLVHGQRCSEHIGTVHCELSPGHPGQHRATVPAPWRVICWTVQRDLLDGSRQLSKGPPTRRR